MSSPYKRKDHLYIKAKDEGYRSRAAYKLIEIQNKYSLIKNSNKVLDLGCFPGGWLQISDKFIGEKGLVIGVDLKDIEPFKSNKIISIKEDLYNEDNIHKEFEKAGCLNFDVVISDMSPALTGIRDKDLSLSCELFNLSIRYCSLYLKPGGNFLAKIFPSQEFELIFRNQKKFWTSFQKTSLKSTRNSSNELYVIGKGYKNNLL